MLIPPKINNNFEMNLIGTLNESKLINLRQFGDYCLLGMLVL